MQSAAGGTSQRLKPAVAIVFSLSRKPAPAPDTLPVLRIVVIETSPAAALRGTCLPSSIPFSQPQQSILWIAATIPRCTRDRQAHLRILTPDATRYARYPCRPKSERCARPRAYPAGARLDLRGPAEGYQLGQKPKRVS